MKKLTAFIALALTISSAQAATAFYKREYIAGNLKYCVYDLYGDEYIRTYQSYQVCPTSIQV